MRQKLQTWSIYSILMLIYKSLFDFVFLPVYYTVFSYMTGATYMFSSGKFSLSCIAFIVLMLFSIDLFDKLDIYTVIITILYTICIIPMLSVYAFVSFVSIDEIIYPVIFWCILLGYFKRKKRVNNGKEVNLIKIPSLKPASEGILVICLVGTLVCWAWAGFPILLSLSDSTAQRIALRANSMPTLLGYVFMLLGGVILPYLFARFINEKKVLYTVASFICGFLLYSINGMKTWIFLYLFAFALVVLCDLSKNNIKRICYAIVIGLCFLLIICVAFYAKAGKIDFLSQFGRIFCIPNGIGFRSITFFKENEVLLLRESILRSIFETPYPGGSDFFIDYGANRTLTSARSNNGLWGDAFRNFGLLGIIVYPVIIGKVLDVIRISLNGLNLKFQIFVMFLMIWNSVNISFFTWLLTGGVIIVYLLNSFFAKEDLKYRKMISN